MSPWAGTQASDNRSYGFSLSKTFFYGLIKDNVCYHKEVDMNGIRRWSGLMLGLVGGLILVGHAGAQSGAGAGEQGRYSGSSGSQILQEQMYKDRMRELLGEQAQGGQQPQDMQRSTGMRGAEESNQKMQSDQRQSGKSKGEGTTDDQGKAKK
jgi:hypothetical protein